MKSMIAEYGLFLVAIVGSIFVFMLSVDLIDGFKEYSTRYIKTITGVSDTEYK